jgi:hypothetical protein
MLYMDIQRISVAGANENNSIPEIIDFLKQYKEAEVCISVSGQNGGFNTPRYEFVKELRNRYVDEVREICRRHHIYRDNWGERYSYIGTLGLNVDGACEEGEGAWPYRVLSGRMPDALRDMLEFCSFDSMQINFTNCFDMFGFDTDKIAVDFHHNHKKYDVLDDRRLILPYNGVTKEWVHKFRYENHQAGCFAPWAEIRGRTILNILYDASFEGGRPADGYDRPVFHGVCQGYAGGLAPENIAGELDKMERAQTERVPVYLDAESGVCGENCLDLSRAAEFCDNIKKWQNDAIAQAK